MPKECARISAQPHEQVYPSPRTGRPHILFWLRYWDMALRPWSNTLSFLYIRRHAPFIILPRKKAALQPPINDLTQYISPFSA
jgi:hypothetical protein